jgi:hypothetical protein
MPAALLRRHPQIARILISIVSRSAGSSGPPLYSDGKCCYCAEKRSEGTCMSPRLLADKAEVTAVQADPTVSPADKEASASRGLVDVLIEIRQERARILEAMKEALVRGDETEALEHARELTGLPRKIVPTR